MIETSIEYVRMHIHIYIYMYIYIYKYIYLYSKTRLKRNLKGPEYFSAKARFPFNQGTLKINPGHAHISENIKTPYSLIYSQYNH
jgi:hypothetical protein